MAIQFSRFPIYFILFCGSKSLAREIQKKNAEKHETPNKTLTSIEESTTIFQRDKCHVV
jgi:hypothetical protein